MFTKETIYGYKYDRINRLVAADALVGDLVDQYSASWPAEALSLGDESWVYDRVGNLVKQLRTRPGATVAAGPTPEEFVYTYFNGTNRLQKVRDFLGATERNYTYDANGNLLTDDFRHLNATEYIRGSYPYHVNLGSPATDHAYYLYDGNDQRIAKKVVTLAQTTQEMYIKDALGRDLSIVTFTTTSNGTSPVATEYFVYGTDRLARITVSSTVPVAKIQPDEATYFLYDHLGNTRVAFRVDGSNVPTIINALDYYSYGKILREYDNGAGDRYLTTQHERDKETGLDYRGARYYDSDVGRFLSTDPWQDKYPAWSTYNYCMGNPIIFTDPTGKGVEGDYYNSAGKWLGSDGNKTDNKAYIADKKNKDGTFKNAKELSIGNTELLDRAAWVFGECRGSDEVIINRVVNVGEKGKTLERRVSDYYAHAINNGAVTDGGFYESIKIRMSKADGKGGYIYSSAGYFDGTTGNPNSKDYAEARKEGIESLMALGGVNTAISAVIGSVNGGKDPTNGSRAWLGAPSANKYVESADNKKEGAVFQFSFKSENGYHSFYKK